MDARHWKRVGHCDSIKPSKIDAQSTSAIWFWYYKDGRSPSTCAFLNDAFGQQRFNLQVNRPSFVRMKTVRSLSNWPGIGNQLNTVFHHCCLAWTLVEDDTEPIQQRQQLGTLLWLKVVQLHTSKLIFSKTLHRSINTHHSNRQHRRSIPRDKLTHEVSMNSPTRLPAVRGANDIVNLTQPLLYNVGSTVFRL